jgi:2-polyprenyl-6-methoxyphenol hydroxylase-like FAD-dependent oxidoreductase
LNERQIKIIGGGLAGLSLGLGLRRRGIAVTVVEAGTYPRHRVCGEFISGVSEETLEALGIAGAFAGSRHQHSVRWLFQGRPVFSWQLPAPARGISRHRLDERLANMLVDAGGSLITGKRAAIDDRPGVVAASGRRNHASGGRIGLKSHIRGLATAADLEMHAGDNGYAGVAEIEDGWQNVCGIFRIDRAIAARGRDLLPAYLDAGGNHTLAANLRACEWRDGSFSATAGFAPGPQAAGGARVGDAAVMIPPFTGNGMSMAFESAALALDPLEQWACGKLAWNAACQTIDARRAAMFRTRMAVATSAEPWLTRPAAARAISSLAAAGILPLRRMLPLVR